MKVKQTLSLTLMISGLLFCSCKKELSLREKGNLVPKTVDEDPSLPSIHVNGTQLHAEAFGNPDSTLLINIHGGPGGDYRYMLAAKEFANNGYRVVFYDQRGSGLSKRHGKEAYSLQVMVDDLNAVISHYRKSAAQKVILLGHSWGAMLASSYINQYPEKIHGAILVEPGGLTWEQTKEYMSRITPSKFTSELISDAAYLDQFITGKDKEHDILDYKFGLMTSLNGGEASLVGNIGHVPMWRSGAIVNEALIELGTKEGFDWTTNLHKYQKKVLFIYSERNKEYGLSHAKAVGAPYPNIEYTMTAGGHDMIYEFFSEFYTVSGNYLNSIK